jgi:hypothetical protein
MKITRRLAVRLIPFALVLLTACAVQQDDLRSGFAPSRGLPDPGVVPAGAAVSLVTRETVDASEPGKSFRAELASDLIDSRGEVLVPKSSPAELAVVETTYVDDAARFLSLALLHVTVKGRRYSVAPADEPNARVILGSALGAIGSSGSVEVTTSGPKVSVPRQTTLTFRLDQPVKLVT